MNRQPSMMREYSSVSSVSVIRQRGAVLVVSLILLLVLTIIGLSSIEGTLLQERMAGNMRDSDMALQAAESGMRDAEIHIEKNIATVGSFADDCSGGTGGGLCTARSFSDDHDRWDDPVLNVFDVASNKHRTASAISGIPSAPKYIIEHLTDIKVDENITNVSSGYADDVGGGEVAVFRITVLATGGSGSSQVMVQSNYGKRL